MKLLDEKIRMVEKYLDSKLDYSKEIKDIELVNYIDDSIKSMNDVLLVNFKEKKTIIEYIFNKKRRLSFIEPFLRDDEVEEIMINGPNELFVERNGRIEKCENIYFDKEELYQIVQSIAKMGNRTVNQKNPIMDARLIDGERVCCILDNVATNGPIISIRKFSKSRITLDNMVNRRSITKTDSDMLKQCVKSKKNIFISGGTSTGKTTMLNALSDYIGVSERVVTIEDARELDLRNVKNIIKMETRSRTLGEGLEINGNHLLKTALRLRPDRIIMGEVRGSEAFYMLQAMNTGHQGSMSTGHGNSCEDMLCRLETMILTDFLIDIDAIRRYIASAIDIMIHLDKDKDGKRKVSKIQSLSYDFERGYYALKDYKSA